MEGGREGKHLAAAGTLGPTIQGVNFLRLWASKHGFPTLATVQLLCILPQLVSKSVTDDWGKMCAKYCSRLALARLHLLQHQDLSVSDLESSLRLLAKQD